LAAKKGGGGAEIEWPQFCTSPFVNYNRQNKELTNICLFLLYVVEGRLCLGEKNRRKEGSKELGRDGGCVCVCVCTTSMPTILNESLV
jgi:hypothetical protein